MSARRPYERPDLDVSFDHGAQYFTARSALFSHWIRGWSESEVAAPWDGRIGSINEPGRIEIKDDSPTRWVGTPHMRAPAEVLARDLDVRQRHRILSIERIDDDGEHEGMFMLRAGEGEDDVHGPFDRVIVNTPPAQAAPLIRPLSSELADTIESVPMDPTWAVMVSFEDRLDLEVDAAFVNLEETNALSWFSRDGSKPGHEDGGFDSFVLHSTQRWASAHLEEEGDEIAAAMVHDFLVAVGLPTTIEPYYVLAHRWRYAKSPAPLDQSHLHDEHVRLGVCGDWCATGRVEGAFLSGIGLAGSFLRAMAHEEKRSGAKRPPPGRPIKGVLFG